MKTSLSKMFGFALTQPIYITLMQMRVVHIAALITTGYWMDKIVTRLVEGGSEHDMTSLALIAGTLLGAFWKAVDGLNKKVTTDQASE